MSEDRHDKDNPEVIIFVSLIDGNCQNNEQNVRIPDTFYSIPKSSVAHPSYFFPSSRRLFNFPKKTNNDSPVNNGNSSQHSKQDHTNVKSKSLSFEKELKVFDKISNSLEIMKNCDSKETISSCGMTDDESLDILENMCITDTKSEDASSIKTQDSNDSSKDAFDVGQNQSVVMDGWVIVKKLSDFADLHKNLCSHWSAVSQVEVPSLPAKSIFSKNIDRNVYEKLRVSAQQYLSNLTWYSMRPLVCQSVLLYEFLCPSPEMLWRPQSRAKKSKFSLYSLFKTRDCQAGIELENHFADSSSQASKLDLDTKSEDSVRFSNSGSSEYRRTRMDSASSAHSKSRHSSGTRCVCSSVHLMMNRRDNNIVNIFHYSATAKAGAAPPSWQKGV